MDDIRHKLVTKPTRFLDKLRLHIRQQGLAYTTEKTYIHWVKRFIYFHNKKHPDNLGIVDVEAFLSHLAVNQFCSLSTQKIALNALVYLWMSILLICLFHQLKRPDDSLLFTPSKKLPIYCLSFQGYHD